MIDQQFGKICLIFNYLGMKMKEDTHSGIKRKKERKKGVEEKT